MRRQNWFIILQLFWRKKTKDILPVIID
jgi:hypothetical protein